MLPVTGPNKDPHNPIHPGDRQGPPVPEAHPNVSLREGVSSSNTPLGTFRVQVHKRLGKERFLREPPNNTRIVLSTSQMVWGAGVYVSALRVGAYKKQLP